MSGFTTRTTAAPPRGERRAYPVLLDLRGRSTLVVGAGRVAAGKVRGLLDAGAAVTVVAPRAVERIRADGRVDWRPREYEQSDVVGRWLVITATGHRDVDGAVHRDATGAGVWVNSADDVERCSFTLPAVARRGPLTVAVGTGGRSPAMAAWLRRRAQEALDTGLDELVELLAEARAELRAATGSSEHPGWSAAFDDGLYERWSAGDEQGARTLLRSHLGLDEVVTA